MLGDPTNDRRQIYRLANVGQRNAKFRRALGRNKSPRRDDLAVDRRKNIANGLDQRPGSRCRFHPSCSAQERRIAQGGPSPFERTAQSWLTHSKPMRRCTCVFCFIYRKQDAKQDQVEAHNDITGVVKLSRERDMSKLPHTAAAKPARYSLRTSLKV